jgi:hypothetical protein
VITVSGAGTPFASGDTYRVVVFGQKKGYDSSTDTEKTTVQNPDYARTTDPEPLIAAAQTLTASFADVGYEVSTSGYNWAAIWIKLTVQQATNMQIQVLAKHTSAGTEEYNLPIEAVSSGLITISSEVIQFPDANGLYIVKVPLNNVIPYIQIQIKETDNGTDATLDTCYITKGY